MSHNKTTTHTELRSVIVRNPLVVTPETKVRDAIAQMFSMNTEDYPEEQSSCVLILEDQKVVGIITERDVIKLTVQQRSLETLTVREVMASPVATMRESEFTDLSSVMQIFTYSSTPGSPDGVVDAHRAGDGDLGAHPIGRCGQQRPAELPVGRDVEQAGEAAEVTDDLGPLREGDRPSHKGDREFTGLDVHSGRCVRRPTHGHGRSSASAAPPPSRVVTPSASADAPATTRRSMPSSTCFPSSSGSGRSTG